MLDEKIIIYEDSDLLIIDKPSGILSVPTPKKEKYTLESAINSILQNRENPDKKAFPCHRLDREASGLIIFAKGQDVQQKVMAQFKSGLVKKKYIAFIQGLIKNNSGTISFPLENKKAITKYKLVQRRKDYSIILAEPATGRTNQIRIHFKMIGHPLLGERKFAFGKDSKVKFRRAALHACEVEFRHPTSGKIMKFSSRLPDDMNRLVGSIKY